MVSNIKKQLDGEDNRRFWDSVKRAATEVSEWPSWKKWENQIAMQDVPTEARRYILWPTSAGDPPRDALGVINTSGALGLMEEKSCYLTAYPKWPDARRPKDLEPGQCIRGVEYRLSGVGHYDVYRVI